MTDAELNAAVQEIMASREVVAALEAYRAALERTIAAAHACTVTAEAELAACQRAITTLEIH